MPRREQPSVAFEDADGNRLHATWSRSWNTLIVTSESRQVSLRPEQVAELLAFLTASIAERDAPAGVALPQPSARRAA